MMRPLELNMTKLTKGSQHKDYQIERQHRVVVVVIISMYLYDSQTRCLRDL